MRRFWYRRMIVMILVFAFSVGGSWYVIRTNQKALEKEVGADTSNELLIPGGMPVGIYLETEGALVLGTEGVTGEDGEEHEPAAHLVKEGDYIIALDDEEIKNKSQLIEAVAALESDDIVLTVLRNNQKIDIRMKAVRCERNEYKLGIWVRDNAQGLGTDTGQLLNAADGLLYTTSIKDIQKGENGTPGGMEGIIVYNNYNILGTIQENTSEGIYGKLDRVDTLFTDTTPMEPVLDESEVKEGEAVVRCAVSGSVKDYEIRITKVDENAKESNKKLQIEVTDKELLELTGGIVQGMSGSPIIQDNKIVGAVTHVFVNNPKEGYGIFIQDMLKHIE